MSAALLGLLLRERPAPVAVADLAAFHRETAPLRARFQTPLERAVAGGLVSDRLGFAFASGYQGALQAMVPSILPEDIASFCVTEEGGNHPKAVNTQLSRRGADVVLSGKKRWCVALANVLVVVARESVDAGGRPLLRAVRVPVGVRGLTLTAGPTPPFVPEVAHAELVLEDVVLPESAVLPGDGYDAYTKPFRTVEDLHVQAALLGYLYSVGLRAPFPEDVLERIAALVVTAQGLATLSPRAPETHVALAGFLSQTATLLADAEPHWGAVSGDERARWERDRVLVMVASKARAARRERAWQSLAPEKS